MIYQVDSAIQLLNNWGLFFGGHFEFCYEHVRGLEPGNLRRWSLMIWKDFSLYYGAFPDLHLSKALISLVPFNLHFHCFQG